MYCGRNEWCGPDLTGDWSDCICAEDTGGAEEAGTPLDAWAPMGGMPCRCCGCSCCGCAPPCCWGAPCCCCCGCCEWTCPCPCRCDCVWSGCAPSCCCNCGPWRCSIATKHHHSMWPHTAPIGAMVESTYVEKVPTPSTWHGSSTRRV